MILTIQGRFETMENYLEINKVRDSHAIVTIVVSMCLGLLDKFNWNHVGLDFKSTLST